VHLVREIKRRSYSWSFSKGNKSRFSRCHVRACVTNLLPRRAGICVSLTPSMAPAHRKEKLLGFHYLTAHIMTAIRANDMRRHGSAALGARRKLLRFFGIMRPARAGSCIALTAFWDSHVRTFSNKNVLFGKVKIHCKMPKMHGNRPFRT
jgi:hypothetical protein